MKTLLPQQPPVDVRPTFRRIHDHLLSRIGRGEWRAGEPMPGENALAAEYAVSVGTMRKALDILQAGGVIQRRRGIGTVVRRRSLENTYFSFFRFRNTQGQLQVPQDRVLAHGSHPANAFERQSLQLSPGAMVHRIRRVRLTQDKPFATDTMSFPHSRFAHFAWPEARTPGTAYGYIEQAFGVLVTYVQERLRIVAPGVQDARLLQAGPGVPVLEVLRVAFDLGGSPVECRRTLALTEHHHYLVELRQTPLP